MTTAEKLLADVLNLPQVPADAKLGTPPEWDSLAHMRLVLALEECTGTQLSATEIVSLASLVDIEALLAQQVTKTAKDDYDVALSQKRENERSS